MAPGAWAKIKKAPAFDGGDCYTRSGLRDRQEGIIKFTWNDITQETEWWGKAMEVRPLCNTFPLPPAWAMAVDCTK